MIKSWSTTNLNFATDLFLEDFYMKYNFFLSLAVLMIICSAISNSSGESYSERYSKGFRQDPTIPQWCRYTHFGDLRMRDKEKFFKKFGPEWEHMHHYCQGLYETSYAIQHPENAEFYLREGIGGFNYVLERMKRNHFFRYDVLFHKAKALMLLKDYTEAAKQYMEIIKVKKDYIPAYIGLSNAYVLIGDRISALKILEHAQKQFPSNTAIENQMIKLQK